MTDIQREYPQHPLIGVAGVVFKGDDVLLIKRGNPPAQGQWSVPGGLVELGESLDEAVLREIAEETGVKAKLESLVEVVQRMDHDGNDKVLYHFVILDFLCSYESGEPKADSDAQQARWFKPEELDILNLDARMRQVITKARQMAKC